MAKVRRGFAREDLFVCVHEQFMTDTARYADVVLPATMFLEHEDLYTAGGHQHLQFAAKAIDPPPGCRFNHEVVCALAAASGPSIPPFDEPARDHRPDPEGIRLWRPRGSSGSAGSTCSRRSRRRISSTASDFRTAIPVQAGLAADALAHDGMRGAWHEMPRLPDHWAVNESRTNGARSSSRPRRRAIS